MILWVDDDIASSLEAFVDELEEAGYKLVNAKNPDEMWVKLKDSESIDGIIMDMMMPVGKTVDKEKSKLGMLTGLELAKQLQKNISYKSIKIIVFTILTDQNLTAWAEDNDVPVLKKQDTLPFELLEKVESLGISKTN